MQTDIVWCLVFRHRTARVGPKFHASRAESTRSNLLERSEGCIGRHNEMTGMPLGQISERDCPSPSSEKAKAQHRSPQMHTTDRQFNHKTSSHPSRDTVGSLHLVDVLWNEAAAFELTHPCGARLSVLSKFITNWKNKRLFVFHDHGLSYKRKEVNVCTILFTPADVAAYHVMPPIIFLF
jgi:hypothetical protein